MFERPEKTYETAPDLIQNILKDDTNPLNRICRLVPAHCNILDIGAGNGLLARVFKESGKAVTIDGIEQNDHAAAIASQYYRSFYTGYAQDFLSRIQEEKYDFIVLADVIEHIGDPLSFLTRLTSAMSSHTRLILSVPNVAFGAVRLALLDGHFDYVDSGLLERTHLRFFTLATLKIMIRQAGMHVEKLCLLNKNFFCSEVDLKKIDIEPLALCKIARDELAWAYQFLLVLSKEPVVTEKRSFGRKDFLPVLYYFIRKKMLCRNKEQSC